MAAAIAVDAAGNSVVTGDASSGANFGGGVLTGGPNSNLFIARFDTGGNHLTSKLFTNATGKAVAAGSARYAVAGLASKTSSINFGCGAHAASSGGGYDAVVAAFVPSNACAWSKRFVAPGFAAAAAVIAVDAADDFLVVIDGLGTGMDLGCGPISFPAGFSNKVLVKLSETTGACLWNVAFSNGNGTTNASSQMGGIGVDASGNVTITGTYSNRLDVGTAAFTSGEGVFLAQFDTSGAFRWAKELPLFVAPVLNVGATGKLIVGGVAMAGTDVGGGPFANDGPFLAEFDATGQFLWSRSFPAVNPSWSPSMLPGVTYAGASEALLAGTFPGQVDLGKGAYTTAGGFDIFLARVRVP
jgi:hypothetical protein